MTDFKFVAHDPTQNVRVAQRREARQILLHPPRHLTRALAREFQVNGDQFFEGRAVEGVVRRRQKRLDLRCFAGPPGRLEAPPGILVDVRECGQVHGHGRVIQKSTYLPIFPSRTPAGQAPDDDTTAKDRGQRFRESAAQTPKRGTTVAAAPSARYDERAMTIYPCPAFLAVFVAGFLPSVPRAADFDRDIRPIFAARCLTCHGPEKQKSGLRLDQKAAAFRGGDSGSAIVPGKSGASLLIQRVSSRDRDEPCRRRASR